MGMFSKWIRLGLGSTAEPAMNLLHSAYWDRLLVCSMYDGNELACPRAKHHTKAVVQQQQY